MRKTLVAAIAAGLLALLTCSQAHAWFVAHRGFTGYNPYTGGFAHYGRTVGVGPYGYGYRSADYSPYTGLQTSSYYRGYSPSMYGSYGVYGRTNYYGNGAVVRSTTIYP